MEYGLLLLRLVVGLLFAGHGAQKLFGWFGGGGPAGTADFFASLGYRWPARMACSHAVRMASRSTGWTKSRKVASDRGWSSWMPV